MKYLMVACCVVFGIAVTMPDTVQQASQLVADDEAPAEATGAAVGMSVISLEIDTSVPKRMVLVVDVDAGGLVTISESPVFRVGTAGPITPIDPGDPTPTNIRTAVAAKARAQNDVRQAAALSVVYDLVASRVDG